MKFIIKGFAIASITVAAICGSSFVHEIVPTQAAQSVFNARGYDPVHDVRFAIADLQQYSIEVAAKSSALTLRYDLAIWGVALGTIGLIVGYKPKEPDLTKMQFKRWVKAVRANNSEALAAIEMQVQNDE